MVFQPFLDEDGKLRACTSVSSVDNVKGRIIIVGGLMRRYKSHLIFTEFSISREDLHPPGEADAAGVLV